MKGGPSKEELEAAYRDAAENTEDFTKEWDGASAEAWGSFLE